MKFTQKTIGFTLIELLVVITIIGILAVGGTATYTAQIQKARDSTRLTDLNALRAGVEQYYQDYAEYPPATATGILDTVQWVAAFLPKIPRDVKSGQLCSNGDTGVATGCDYMYNANDDVNGIKLGIYRVSAAFENKVNATTKGNKDGGIYNAQDTTTQSRLEFGLALAQTTSPTPTVCLRTTVSSPITTVTGLATLPANNCPSGAGVIIAGN